MGQSVKFVELVHDCILSKQQRNEMNRRYCDAVRYETFDGTPPAVQPIPFYPSHNGMKIK